MAGRSQGGRPSMGQPRTGTGAGGGAFPGFGATIPTLGPNEGTAGVGATAQRVDAIPKQYIEAQWPIGTSTRRYFAVDFVNGNDANAGFSDVSMAAAGAVAKKTIAGLAAIFPKVGAGRSAEIAIANGGVNTTQAYAEDLLGVLLSGCSGYAANSPIVRATGTNTNASSIAFAGDANDCVYAGGVTATGCNAPGYNPIGAPTNQVVQCQQVGGAAAAIPGEPAAPLMWRIRFRTDTTTAALRGICRTVAKVSTTTTANDTITTSTTLPAVPVLTDTFVLEQAGVTMTGGNLWQCNYGGVPTGNVRSLQLVGIIFTSGVTVSGSGFTGVFWGVTGSLTLSNSVYASDFRYVHPLGTQTCGGGLHVTTSLFTNNGGMYSFQVTCVETTMQCQAPNLLRWSQTSVCGTGFAVLGYGGSDTLSAVTLGAESTELTCRILGSNASAGAGLSLTNCRVMLGKIDFTGMGARPGLLFIDSIASQQVGTALTGTTGNTNYGLAVSVATGNNVYNSNGVTTNTLTGTSGDIRMISPTGTDVVLTWAQVNATGFADGRNNRIIVANSPTAMVKFTGSIVTSAVGATNSYLADPGAALAVANLAAQRYPTSMRLMVRLRVTKLTGAGVLTNNVTATLYKNNVATAMTVTVLAADAAGTKYVDSTHPVLYVDGDDYDVRLDDAADVLAGTLQVSAGLEYSI